MLAHAAIKIRTMRTTVTRLVAGLCLSISVLGLLAYFSRVDNRYVVALASFTPFLLSASVIGAVVAAFGRRWILFTASVAALATGVGLFAPLYVPGSAAAASEESTGPTLRIMQSNLMLGLADPDQIVREVVDRDIDILTVQELTNSALSGLDVAGLDDLLPYKFTRPTPEGGGGAGIYSRFPLANERELPTFLLWNLSTDIDVGTGPPIRVYSVHPVPPYPSPTPVWASEMELLKEEVTMSAVLPRVIVSGDFNSTWSHSRFRDIVDVGYTDAAESTGGGVIPTYPTDKAYPALVGIDHVLSRGMQATSLERITVDGTDHHGIVAELKTTG